MNKEKSVVKKWLYWFSLAIAIIFCYKLLDDYTYVINWLRNLFTILMPFLIGILISYILYMPCKKVEQICDKSKSKFIKKKSRMIAIIIIYILVTILLILFVKFLVPVITQSILDLGNNFQNYYNSLIEMINDLPEDSILKSDIAKDIISNIKDIDLKQFINLQKIGEYIEGILSAANAIVNVFIAIIVSVYVLYDRRKIVAFIKKLVNSLFETKVAIKISNYFNRTNEILLKFIGSQFLDAIIVGILTGIVMNIMGIKYATLLGLMIGLFNIIPYFGAIVAVVISAIITIFTGGFTTALWMTLIVIIVQQIDANIINPRILGNSLNVSPILVIFSTTLGGAYFGVPGMFLGVPVASLIKVFVLDFIKEKNELKETELKEE